MRITRLTAVLVLLTTAAVSAQRSAATSLARDWTHAWGAPHFTDDIPSTESAHGIIDRLNHVFYLDYNSSPVTLSPGSYVAQVRLKKNVTATGAAPLTLSAQAGNQAMGTVTLSVAEQTVDRWVETTPLVITVGPTTPALTFRFGDIDTSRQKTNYDFDALTVKPLPVVLSCANDFTYQNSQYLAAEQTTQSSFGRVMAVAHPSFNYLYGSPTPIVLPPGTYALKLRAYFAPAQGGSGMSRHSDLYSLLRINDVEQVARLASAQAQPTSVWFDTEPLTFTVTELGTTVQAAFGNVTGTNGSMNGYKFDRIEIVPVDRGVVGLAQDQTALLGTTVTYDAFAPGAPDTDLFVGFALGVSIGFDLGDRSSPIDADGLFFLSMTPGNGVITDNITSTSSSGMARTKAALTLPNLPFLRGLALYAAAFTIRDGRVVGTSQALPFTML